MDALFGDSAAMIGFLLPLQSVFCGVLFVVFGSAFVAKIANRHTFADAVRGYGLLPEPFVRPLAVILLACEGLIASLVLHPSTLSLGLALAAGLSSLFAFAVALSLMQGLDNSCGCGWYAGTVRWSVAAVNCAVAFLTAGSIVAVPGEMAWLEHGTLAALGAASTIAGLTAAIAIGNARKLAEG